MQVTRRKAIQQFLFVSAGVAILPACLQDDKSKSAILLKNFQVSGQQEKMLEELTETIIPTTATPGAKAVSAHLFALKMLDDCYKKEDQQQFMKGLTAFDKTAQEKFDQPFLKCNKTQRDTLLAAIDGKKDLPAELAFFYTTAKKLTIQAYTGSRFYLTSVQVYKMIPGKYRGCIPVKNHSIKTS
ncbi:MAG: gluconate 2-dehydrogenase subunit 3 family protein [Chitinophagaceae bacterium]